MVNHNHDELFMKQALELARQGVGLASPNPYVGAVIVDERGRIVGRGFHTYEGKSTPRCSPSKKRVKMLGEHALYQPRAVFAYRTNWPCADAVIAAGIHRVVAAMRDPNPLVAGKGFNRLRAAGVEVVEGILEGEARRLNESFSRFIRTRMPFGVLKTAMTLDGKIGAPGVSRNPTALGSGQASHLHHRRGIAEEGPRASA